MAESKDLTPLDQPPDTTPVFREKMEKIFASVYSQDDPELPLLPEKHRMFAFRWATEFRTNADWGRIFHVSDTRIAEWKKNPKILKYYLIIRRKQNLVLMERMKLLETKAFQKLYELLDMDITDKNADVIRKTIMNVLGVDVEGTLNLRVTAEARAVASTSALGGEAKAAAKVETSLDIKKLRDRLDEMALLEDLVIVEPEPVESDVNDKVENNDNI
ncbi:MAG: hypothetical protein C4K49_10715 [Candidatus Thorarchaeota archaeon]|nr:MAG: hypothetical protein C4K49_10715 [Candidatus Thorarchaeota archaeon]